MAFFRAEGRPARSKSGHIFFFPGTTLRRVLADAGFAIAESHTNGIRRGLRILGWYPRSARWKRACRPVPPPPASNEVRAPPGRRHGDSYYRYRFAQAEIKRLPGLLPIGLDFQLLLTPASPAADLSSPRTSH